MKLTDAARVVASARLPTADEPGADPPDPMEQSALTCNDWATGCVRLGMRLDTPNCSRSRQAGLSKVFHDAG